MVDILRERSKIGLMRLTIYAAGAVAVYLIGISDKTLYVSFMNQSPPKEIYATLSGTIDPEMVKRVFASFSAAVNNGFERVHLLIQSTGGTVGDGIGIYNYLRNLPLELVAYNGGSVASSAVVVFLAAKMRKASATASFTIHKSLIPTNLVANSTKLKLLADGLSLEDQRTEEILRSHINLPASKWRIYRMTDLIITAHQAVQFGLIHEVSDFVPPRGTQLYNL